jgi:hypothetical protein
VELNVPQAKPSHLQEDEAVPETGNIGIAILSVAIAHKHIAHPEVHH